MSYVIAERSAHHTIYLIFFAKVFINLLLDIFSLTDVIIHCKLLMYKFNSYLPLLCRFFILLMNELLVKKML
jgi:hypothetical protein